MGDEVGGGRDGSEATDSLGIMMKTAARIQIGTKRKKLEGQGAGGCGQPDADTHREAAAAGAGQAVSGGARRSPGSAGLSG